MKPFVCFVFGVHLITVSGILLDNRIRSHGRQKANEEHPNIIIFYVDDFGWGDLGANMNSSEHTPNMNKLAASGLRLTDFHVASSVCSPSRAAVLTGRMGLRNGVNMLFGPSNVGGLPLQEHIIPQYLKQVGYSTFAIGKWHLGHHGSYNPTKRGFDHWLGVPYSLDQGCVDITGGINPYCLPCDPPKPKPKNATFCNSNHLGLPLYRDDVVIEQPLDFRTLSDHYVDEFRYQVTSSVLESKPVFGYIPFSHLHVPIGYNPRYSEHSTSTFHNTLFELDSSIGRMMDVLDELGIRENTMIWLFGDNGPWESQCQYAGKPGPFQGLWQKKPTGGGGGTSWKLTIWEGGHRVPGIVSWPSRIQPGVSDALISSLDILPTLMNLVDVKLPVDREYDGIDVSRVLFYGSRQGNEVLFHPRSNGQSGNIDAVRYGDYKAVFFTAGGGPLKNCAGKTNPSLVHNPPLLFNLKDDIAEEFPLDTSAPKLKQILQHIIQLRQAKLNNIQTTLRSKVDTRFSSKVRPCCNAKNEFCRCSYAGNIFY